MTIPDVVPVIEAAYRVENNSTDWLQGVVEALVPVVGRGFGVHCFRFECDRSGHYYPCEPVCSGATPEWAELWQGNWWERWILPLDSGTIQKAISFGPCCYSTQLWSALSREIPTYSEFLTQLARGGYAHALPEYASSDLHSTETNMFYPESFNLVALGSSSSAVVVCANIDARSCSTLSRKEIDIWEMVTAHIAAGDRIRRRLASNDPTQNPNVEAVMSPAGNVLHAEAGAKAKVIRERLREVAKQVDRARMQKNRHDPQTSLSLWRALYDQEWSVMDQFDSDGRRYVIARRNPVPDVGLSLPLSPQERQVADLVAMGHSNKAIAYEMGIAISTVATHVLHIKKQLKVTSRSGIIRIVRSRIGGRV